MARARPRRDTAGEEARGARRDERARAVRTTLVVTLFLNLLTVAAKGAAGWVSDSLSVLADAAHSGVDALNNVLALFLARVAAQLPDDDHPYGHAKFETLGALGVVAFLSITVYELGTSAVARLVRGEGSGVADPILFPVMVGSAMMSGLISWYEARRGRALGSELLVADAAHTQSDVYASLAVLAGLGLTRAGIGWADSAFTLVVAVLIARTGWGVLRSTVPVLVDQRALEPETICGVAFATPGVVGCYNARSRGRQGQVFAELTVAVDPALGVAQAHEIADAVEQRIIGELGAREVVVHVEPQGHSCKQPTLATLP